MKKMLALVFVALLAAGAMAQDNDNSLGMFFTDDIAGILALDDPENPADEPMHPNSNWVNAFAPFNGYVVILYPTVDTIGGYELGIGFVPESPFVLAVFGPNGWTNFGDNTNQLVGFTTPVPAAQGGAVLATMNLLYTGIATINIEYGPSNPSSVGDAPAIADGANPDNLIACGLASAPQYWPTVATINGDGVVAVEAASFSSVKALFE